MTSQAKTLLAPSAQDFPFPYLVIGVLCVALVLGGLGALGLAGAVPGALLNPSLLLLMGAVAMLAVLSLWVVARYEQRLTAFAENRARNRAIVDNMLDGAIHIDALGRIAGVNAAAEDLFGYRARELRGQPIAILFASPERERLKAEMTAEPELGLPPALVGKHQMQGRRRDGDTLPLSLAITEVHVGGYLVYTAVVSPLSATAAEGDETLERPA